MLGYGYRYLVLRHNMDIPIEYACLYAHLHISGYNTVQLYTCIYIHVYTYTDIYIDTYTFMCS